LSARLDIHVYSEGFFAARLDIHVYSEVFFAARRDIHFLYMYILRVFRC
jgi:hypothetical protein